MSIRIGWLALASLAVVCVGTAQAQIDGVKTNARVFNDFSTSQLLITNNNSVNDGPGVSLVTVTETGFVDDGMGGSFTNRHDFILSRTGATEHLFSIDDSWTHKAIVTLDGAVDVPNVKEAGLRINAPGVGETCTPMDPTPCTGDALFLVKTNGEIAAFGGGAPFFSFSAGMGVTNDYVPGTPILLGWTMTAAGDGIGPGDNLIEYFIDRLPGAPGGEESSGPLPFDNIEGGPAGYNLGMYVQGPPASPVDIVTASFNDIMFVPEPGTALMSLLGIAIVGLVQRRRGR